MARKPRPAPADSQHAATPDLEIHEPEIHPDLNPLFRAVVWVVTCSHALERCYPLMQARLSNHGKPELWQWPGTPEHLATHEHWERLKKEDAAAGRPISIAPDAWSELLLEWSGYYKDWFRAIEKAKKLVQSAAVSAIMDAGESRPAHRWTTQTIIDLDNLAGTLHPIGMGGVDGLGFVRFGLPPLPANFRTYAEAVGKRIAELRSIPVSAVPPIPTLASGDHGKYQPARWFRGKIAARLRMAAHKNRRTKRVATKVVDSVVCYSVADVRRWWPEAIPRDAK